MRKLVEGGQGRSAQDVMDSAFVVLWLGIGCCVFVVAGLLWVMWG